MILDPDEVNIIESTIRATNVLLNRLRKKEKDLVEICRKCKVDNLQKGHRCECQVQEMLDKITQVLE